VEETVFDLVGLLQDGIGPILPFQPVGSLSDAHHVGSDLRIEIAPKR
jgi:hypothetical protein